MRGFLAVFIFWFSLILIRYIVYKVTGYRIDTIYLHMFFNITVISFLTTTFFITIGNKNK